MRVRRCELDRWSEITDGAGKNNRQYNLCHPERSEGSCSYDEVLRFAQDDRRISDRGLLSARVCAFARMTT